MKITLSETPPAARQLLIDAGFTLHPKEELFEMETPPGWTIHDVGPTNSFLVDPDGNLWAELVRDISKPSSGWYLIPRSPFVIISFGCAGGTVIHLGKAIHSGPNPGSWLDHHYPGWSEKLQKYWKK